jgi:hypothetical protein
LKVGVDAVPQPPVNFHPTQINVAPVVTSSLPAGSQDSERTVSVAMAEEVTTVVEKHSVEQAESAQVEDDITVV